MQYVVYKKPAVSDKHYDEYPWERHSPPFDDEREARDSMPSVGSEVGEGYNYAVVPYADDEEIKTHLDDGEKQSQKRKHR